MYRSSDKLLQQLARHIAAKFTLCVLENFCENLCFSNRILSPQQLTRIQSDLLLCDSLRRQNSVAETKIFAKVLQLTRSDLPLRSVSVTYCLVSSGLYSKGDLLFKSAPVSTHFCYQLLASLDVILAVQEAPATVTTVLLSAGSNYGNCLSCGLAKTCGATFSTNEK